MTIARYIDPKTKHIFSLTAEEAQRLGYKLYAKPAPAPEAAPEVEPAEAPKPPTVGGFTKRNNRA